MVVKFMCEFLVLLTINMLWHVEVMFDQLLNLLERYCVYLHLCLLGLSSHEIVSRDGRMREVVCALINVFV